MSHHYTLPTDAVWFSESLAVPGAVTGCSAGMGPALAQLIASHPTHRLVAIARRLLILELDVTSEEAIEAAFDAAVSKFGRFDIMVNNAGYGLMGDSEKVLQPQGRVKARKAIETDLWGTLRLTVHAVRIFPNENIKTGQQGGGVLNVTSTGGFAGFPGTSFYHAANKEVRPEWNIHFCLIEPGGTRSNLVSPASLDWMPEHPAYTASDSPTRVLASYVKDPTFAEAVYEVVARATTKSIPMRLPLTRGVWDIVKNELVGVEKEPDEIKELCLSVEVDDANIAGNFLRSKF
ncbi:retinol dehydrogenase 8 [Xylariaceae sp. FL0255]|nr:retinol dehydrogenase 8 [Xylariaceae sp. FL0255]